MSAVECSGVTVFYPGNVILKDVSFTLEPGQGIALIGGNGSGKTTLLKAILGEVSTKGSLTVCGHAPGRAPRGSIGYVPQANQLDPTFPITAQAVVDMAVRCAYSRKQRREMNLGDVALRSLDIVGLRDRSSKRFGDLSGGQQQRVLVARALALNPKLIMLDEPFNGLDQQSRSVLIDVLNDLKSDGVSVICSTHDMALSQAVCDIVGEIKDKTLTVSAIEGAGAGSAKGETCRTS